MSRPRRWRVWRPVLAMVAGLVIFGTLSMLAAAANEQNEQRLLERQTRQSALVIDVAVGEYLHPIDTMARVADATDGAPSTFEAAARPLVSDIYTGLTLVDRSDGQVIATVGPPPLLDSNAITDTVARTSTNKTVVVNLVRERRIGYAVVDDRTTSRFAIYFERVLPADATERTRFDQPFASLDYAFYLGDEEQPANLLTASVDDLPLSGRRSTATIDYGDTQILLVTRAAETLGSPLMAHLWWIVLVGGLGGSATTAALLYRLGLSRDEAMSLALENAKRHREQRDIAETLQLSLLPSRLDTPPATAVASRYWTAGVANLIGGDFYDLFQIDERRWGMLIGDVCGKGIESAALIGLVRHTIRASVLYTDSPSAALHAVHLAMGEHEPPTFCTAAFMIYSPDAEDPLSGPTGSGTLTVALAGHPQPVLGGADGHARPIGRHGTILGMVETEIHDETVTIDAGDTLLLYTDGLTDAPRNQAVSLEELVALVGSSSERTADQLADEIRRLKRSRRPEGSADDTAVLVLRFETVPAPVIPPEPVVQAPRMEI